VVAVVRIFPSVEDSSMANRSGRGDIDVLVIKWRQMHLIQRYLLRTEIAVAVFLRYGRGIFVAIY
jgi:hypothetical protein